MDSPLPRRPAWPLSTLLDGALAASAYLAAYWLRFRGARLGTFLPGALSTLPFVLMGQLAGLFLARAYAPRPRVDWLLRVLAGVIAGTVVSSIALGLTRSFEGLSRSAFVADAMLLSIAALGWRGVWVLRLRAQARRDARAPVAGLVDRTAETNTVRAVVV